MVKSVNPVTFYNGPGVPQQPNVVRRGGGTAQPEIPGPVTTSGVSVTAEQDAETIKETLNQNPELKERLLVALGINPADVPDVPLAVHPTPPEVLTNESAQGLSAEAEVQEEVKAEKQASKPANKKPPA